MKIHITPPSQAQPNSPSSKEYSTQHLLEISQAPGTILLNKSCMQKIKKQQQWKESLSECHYIWLVLILRLEVWMILAWCCSALFTAVAAFSQFSRHCRRAKRSPGENQGLFKSSLSWASLHLTGMERVLTPSHPPICPPWASACSQGQQNTQLLRICEMSRHTGLTIWSAVTEILGSLHNRELSLFPFPELLVLFLI